MKIESILQRQKGTVVEFPGATYHFKAEQPGGPHVAEVADEGHAERLLGIPEGYRAAATARKPAAPTAPVEKPAPGFPHVLQGTGGAEQAGASTDTGASAEQRDEGSEPPPAAIDDASGETKPADAAPAEKPAVKPAAKRGRPAKAK